MERRERMDVEELLRRYDVDPARSAMGGPVPGSLAGDDARVARPDHGGGQTAIRHHMTEAHGPTPAGAGSRSRSSSSIGRARDHPRGRGE